MVMSNIDWPETIRTVASVATAFIAFSALKNWQRQDKAKREAEFLDAVVEETHSFIAKMPTLIALVEIIKIGFKSNAPISEHSSQEDNEIQGAIAYIQKNGERDASRLGDELEKARTSVTKLRSLAAKGNLFNFINYHKCHWAITNLAWQFDAIEGLWSFISNQAWNWENPEVLDWLKNEMAIDPNAIRENTKSQNVAILEFARETYAHIYGPSKHFFNGLKSLLGYIQKYVSQNKK